MTRMVDSVSLAACRRPACLLCGSDGDVSVRPRLSNAIVRWCKRCDAGFTSPRPVVDYSVYTDEARDFERWARFADPLVRWASELGPQVPSTWLDYGAGSGELILVAKRAGISAIGIDLDENARELARSRDALVNPSLEALPDGATFDVVSASHVLEHLINPIDVIRELSGYLTRGGHLVLVQPNPAGLSPRLFPRRWSGWVASQHLWHWTPGSMAATVALAGLEVVAVANSSLSHRADNAPLRDAGCGWRDRQGNRTWRRVLHGGS